MQSAKYATNVVKAGTYLVSVPRVTPMARSVWTPLPSHRIQVKQCHLQLRLYRSTLRGIRLPGSAELWTILVFLIILYYEHFARSA